MNDDPVYVKINRKIWHTQQVRSLSRNARELYMYLITCPHGNMLGLFVLRPGYVLDDLQLGPDRVNFVSPLQEILNTGLFKYDEKTEILLDMNHIIKHPPINNNTVKAAVKIINSLPKTILFQDLKLMINLINNSINKSDTNLTMDLIIKRLDELITNTVTETVTETVLIPKGADAPMDKFNELPSKEVINEAAEPLVKKLINDVSAMLYKDKIFPDVYAFKNTMLKEKKNVRSILHTLCSAYRKRTFTDGAWAYCAAAIEKEDLNYNERDNTKTS
jgi:hypothetical protein